MPSVNDITPNDDDCKQTCPLLSSSFYVPRVRSSEKIREKRGMVSKINICPIAVPRTVGIRNR
jgi:hypothetical protein